ncbi:MAG: 2-oxoacid:acceptor oxidoreductase family protein, partial [Planctomycetota bacterium]
MTEKIILAGFGGQGMMLLGKLLAQAAMTSGKYVTYFPSYGTEV